MSAQLLEVGTVLRLERDAGSMAKWLRQATSEYTPPSPPPPLVGGIENTVCMILFCSEGCPWQRTVLCGTPWEVNRHDAVYYFVAF